jgi:NADH:ubiquinone oxidoreductase subunit K
VDRLDTWLNAQRGWRRLATIGVAWYWPTVWIAFCFWVFPRTSLPVLVIVAIAILALPTAVGLGSIMAVIYSRRARNPKRKKGLAPFFMWRQIVLPWLLIPTLLNATLLNTQGRSTPDERALAFLMIIFSIAIIALALETYRYSRRFTRPRGAGQPALAEEQ